MSCGMSYRMQCRAIRPALYFQLHRRVTMNGNGILVLASMCTAPQKQLPSSTVALFPGISTLCRALVVSIESFNASEKKAFIFANPSTPSGTFVEERLMRAVLNIHQLRQAMISSPQLKKAVSSSFSKAVESFTCKIEAVHSRASTIDTLLPVHEFGYI